jgi:cellulose 1,4-beta-cellobiosidase
LGALATGCSGNQNDTRVCDPSGGSGGTSGATSSAANGGDSDPGNNPGGAGSNGSGNPVGGSASGGANTTSSTGPKPCLDTKRDWESCTDAKQWGFCGQAWFAGYCEITCGVCTPSSGTPGNGTPGGNGTSAPGNGNAGGPGTSTPGNGNGGGAATTTSGNGNPGSVGGSSGNAGGGSSSGGSVVSQGTGPIKPATTAARVDNPYVGVTGYVNPEWKARAEGEPGGSRVSNNPTGVWLDRTAAIKGVNGGMGLRDHLDEAVAQKAGYIQFVIYNLPGRDCSALASNGELGPTDLERYKKEYIDPIASAESDPKYANLRIINIVEIDSLPNLVTNTGSKKTATPNCDVMKANGNYQKGIAYALGELYKAGNTYSYIDAGHHGWIGWEDNFNDSTQLFYQTASSAEGGVATVTGFITNTANYSALQEPYITSTEKTKQSKWVDFNPYVDELSFAKAMRTKLISLGFKSDLGMVIDTSRNGWGGPKRPTAASTASDVETMINESRIDRRIHLGNWCNQSGAGLGERPKAVDADGIDAYVWIKPPGESDGASQTIANDQGKGFDRMCDPTFNGTPRNGNNMSGALGDAPLSGAWFSAQFIELMANAYPPL